jgi:hypothetical protein
MIDRQSKLEIFNLKVCTSINTQGKSANKDYKGIIIENLREKINEKFSTLPMSYSRYNMFQALYCIYCTADDKNSNFIEFALKRISLTRLGRPADGFSGQI